VSFDDLSTAQAFDREGIFVFLRTGGKTAEKFLEEAHGVSF
jgi:hypothetical protein